ncbi:hypothetical protein Ddye_024973 [Dipteronia dyeriana]|uniref:Reverse transcriptase zinc-binding domain-containing protein n=1 Tax=Dipteronia dyeriana TaxID=168575 RepID=A0AAD9TWW5_9ROSI|nr:hypothetical protein Ddye_024973 [Dipteronia dyeriana]
MRGRGVRMDVNDVAKLCELFTLRERDGPLMPLRAVLKNDGEKRLASRLVRKILSNKMVNQDAFMHLIPKIWKIKLDVKIEAVGGVGGMCSPLISGVWRINIKFYNEGPRDLIRLSVEGFGARRSALSLFVPAMCRRSISYDFYEGKKRVHVLRGQRSRGELKITHIFFANDSMLFSRALEKDCRSIRHVLDDQKLATCVSMSVIRSRALNLARIIRVQLVIYHERYLGLLIFVGQNKKQLFTNIRDRFWEKVKGWQSKLFSEGGKEVLLKAVVQAIPTYPMSLFKLPMGLETSVFEAECSTSSSFLWKSFLWGRELLGARIRWRIGDGKVVSIYKVCCLPRPSKFSHFLLNVAAKVSELKLPNGAWNENMIRAPFWPEDVNMILSLPWSPRAQSDSLMWHFDKSGSYSVKSGYHLGCGLFANAGSSGLASSDSWWKYLWRINVSSKVKLLIWRTCFNWIPTGCNLAHFGVHVDDCCLKCNRRLEPTVHACWTFSSLKDVRAKCQFMRGFGVMDSWYFLDLMMICKSKFLQEEFELLCIIL